MQLISRRETAVAKHPENSDESLRLLDRARAGDAAAVEQLLTRHRPFLVHVIDARLDQRLRARLDPSDVVQEAQMEAHRRIQDYLDEPVLPFRLWLRRIAYDRLVMLQRRHSGAARRSVRREHSLADHSSLILAQQLLAPGPSPSEDAVSRELAERVRRAVARLPESEREVLIMRNLEGLSNLEAAEVLGVDPAVSSRRYGRAVLRLRDLLSATGLEGSD
jgi:RNA polymerase sigma-70 factor (ECF subfamily)